ncbi:MAG: LacI family DNA-binding transcriptional regulator, partial [Opitutales bacterium]|nr:LacI family DNA-binding transcriptional regulator [Opitutales bacterium]
MRKVTLRDIAQKSGVSVTSVSLAMRGSRRVSPDKTKEIQELAEKMGYVRDPMMSALCSYRDSTRPRNKNANINFLQFSSSSQTLENQGKVAAEFWRGAQTETKLLGYSLNTIWAGDPSLTSERLKHILNSR